MRVGTRADAQITARAALEVDEQEVLRFHQPLLEELIDGAGSRRRRGLFRLQPRAGGVGQALTDLGEPVQHVAKLGGADPDELDVIQRSAGGGAAALVIQESDLAEIRAPGRIGDDEVTSRKGLGHLHEADADQVEAVGGVALPDDDLARLEADQLGARGELTQKVVADAVEDGHGPEMGLERALPVRRVELGLEALVSLQHAQDIAKHLEHHGLLDRAHGRGPRIEAHARHLAEEVARPQLGNGIVVVQIDGRIDGDESTRAFLAGVVLARHQVGESSEEIRDAQSVLPRPALDVRHGRRDEDVDLSAQDVEGGRSVLTFAADDLAWRKRAAHDGPAIQLEEVPGDSPEDRQAQQLLGIEGRAGWRLGAADDLVRQRPRWTGHHALAARHARGVGHRLIEVEADPRLRTLPGSPDDEVLLEVAAGPDAAIAEDAGGVIDVDDDRGVVRGPPRRVRGESRGRDALARRQRLELAVVCRDLAKARCGMVGEQQLEERGPRPAHALGVRLDDHAGLGRPDARRRQEARACDVYGADPAHADGRHVRSVTQHRDLDP